jgi:hypothetical protein
VLGSFTFPRTVRFLLLGIAKQKYDAQGASRRHGHRDFSERGKFYEKDNRRC